MWQQLTFANLGIASEYVFESGKETSCIWNSCNQRAVPAFLKHQRTNLVSIYKPLWIQLYLVNMCRVCQCSLHWFMLCLAIVTQSSRRYKRWLPQPWVAFRGWELTVQKRVLKEMEPFRNCNSEMQISKFTCMKLKAPWISVIRSSSCCFLKMGSFGKAAVELKTIGPVIWSACQEHSHCYATVTWG